MSTQVIETFLFLSHSNAFRAPFSGTRIPLSKLQDSYSEPPLFGLREYPV